MTTLSSKPSFIFASSEDLVAIAQPPRSRDGASAGLMEQPAFLLAADATLQAMLHDLPRLAPLLGCDAQAQSAPTGAALEAQLGAYLDALRNNLAALLQRRAPSQPSSQASSQARMPQPEADAGNTPATPGPRAGRAMTRSLQSPYTGMLQREIPQLLTGYFAAMLQTMKAPLPASGDASPVSAMADPAIAAFALVGQHLQSACRHAAAARPVEAKAALADAAAAVETFRSVHLINVTRRLPGGDSVLPGPEERGFREQLRVLASWIDELLNETSGVTRARDRAASSPMPPSRPKLEGPPAPEQASPRKPDGLLSSVRKRFFSSDARSPQRTGHRRGDSDGAATSPVKAVAVRFAADSPAASQRKPRRAQDE